MGYVLAPPPSLGRRYPDSMVLCSGPTPCRSSVVSPFFRLRRTYSSGRHWSWRCGQESTGSHWLLDHRIVKRERANHPGASKLTSRLREFQCCLSRLRALRRTPRVTCISGLTPFTAEQPARSILPHFLSVYISSKPLHGNVPFIGSAQHAIMGSRLTITHAGFTPARQLNSANLLRKNHVIRPR